jgi:peptide deformylase
MAAMPLTYYGNSVLREIAQPVRKVNAEIKKLVEHMFETMELERGVGLAAPQVGVSKRVIVIDVSHEGVPPFALINPEIVKAAGSDTDSEGCLSIPGVFLPVTRPAKIKVKGRNLADRQIVFEAEGLLARAIQHEIDHLDGKLFTDLVEDEVALQREMAQLGERIQRIERGETTQAEIQEQASRLSVAAID